MKNIAKLIELSKPLYKSFIVISTLIVFSALLELVTPVLSRYIIDEIIANVQSESGNLDFLYKLIALSFSVSILQIIISSISNRLGDHLSGELEEYLTRIFYRKILTLPQTYFDSEISGKIVNQLARGIRSIKDFSNTATNFILPTFLQSIFTIAILAYYNLSVAALTFLLFPIYLFLSSYSAKKWGEKEVEKNKLEDISRGRIQEVISNIKVVKGFTNEFKEHSFVVNKIKGINKIYAEQSKTYHLFDFARNFSLQLILLIISLIVFSQAFKGNLSIGEVVLIIQLINQARRPLFAMSFILTRIQATESGSKEFFDILELESIESFNSKKNKSKNRLTKDTGIEFQNINFNYNDDKNVLEDISFKINNKETVALVGHSGAGKSTIVNLILKLYKPQSGEIFLGKKKFSELDHTYLRQHISLVFQENELFSTTIRDNVAYGYKASDKQVIQALKDANAYEFVMKLPKKIDTEVGERGIKLSGGQKQRIQIARAILHNKPILILDEATSNLDSKSERLVQQALDRLMDGKMVIIIAHRFSTIQNVDKILVLDEGSIVDSGTPGELAKKPGIYSTLLGYQIEGNKKLLEKFELY